MTQSRQPFLSQGKEWKWMLMGEIREVLREMNNCIQIIADKEKNQNSPNQKRKNIAKSKSELQKTHVPYSGSYSCWCVITLSVLLITRCLVSCCIPTTECSPLVSCCQSPPFHTLTHRSLMVSFFPMVSLRNWLNPVLPISSPSAHSRMLCVTHSHDFPLSPSFFFFPFSLSPFKRH